MGKKLLLLLAGIFGLFLVLFSGTHALATKPNSDDDHKVTICHRTNSTTNPYVKETVDSASVDGNTSNDHGNGDHLAEHTGPLFDTNNPPPPPHNGNQWGDIIPPFYSDGTSDGLPSLNWPSGESFFDNDCNIPTTTPTPTVDPCANNGCVTPTVTPTVTITTTPTDTPHDNGGNPPTSDGGSSCPQCTQAPQSNGQSVLGASTQAVLGVSTMAGTGTFETNVMNAMLLFGMIVLSSGALSYAKEKKA